MYSIYEGECIMKITFFVSSSTVAGLEVIQDIICFSPQYPQFHGKLKHDIML